MEVCPPPSPVKAKKDDHSDCIFPQIPTTGFATELNSIFLEPGSKKPGSRKMELGSRMQCKYTEIHIFSHVSQQFDLIHFD